MIIPLPFIVSLLFTITYATDFTYEIDLKRCTGAVENADTACFVRQSCIENAGGGALILQRIKHTESFVETDKCDVIIQVKVLSTSKYLVLMQITADSGGLDEAKGIAIRQDDDVTPVEQIACKKDSSGNIVHTLDPVRDETSNVLKTSLTFETTKSNKFEGSKMFCALFISSIDTSKDIPSFFNDLKKPSLVYTKGSEEVKIEYPTPGIKFWNQMGLNKKCVINNIESEESANEKYILKLVDLSKPSITCPTEEKLRVLYQGAADSSGKLPDPVESFESDLVCKNVDDEYVWPTLSTSGTYKVACSKLYCSECSDLSEFTTDECPHCKPITKTAPGGCKTLTCGAGEMITTDGKKGVDAGEKGITCVKKPEGGSQWVIGDTTPLTGTKASCYLFKGCDPLTLFACPDDVDCKAEPLLDKTGSNYSCPDADAVLHQNGVKATAVCDSEKHEWSGIDTGKSLYCAIEPKKDAAAKEEPSTGNLGGIVGGIGGGLLLLGLIGGVVYYFLFYKKKQDAAKKTTKKEEGTSKKSSKKSGGVGSSDEGTMKKDKETKKESASDPNKESEKPANAAEPPKDGKEPPKDGKEPAKDGKDAAPAPSPAPTGTTPTTPAAPEAPAPAPIPPDATAV